MADNAIGMIETKGFVALVEATDAMMKAGTPEKIDQEPIGTGPFYLERYIKDAIIRYKAFPQFWGGKAKIDDLVYSINEPDNYAVEEALQIVAKVGGKVSVVTVGADEDEEVLRRQMAMGATHGILLTDPQFDGSDGRGIASILKACVQKGNYDLILTGVQAEDGGAQIGGMLAAEECQRRGVEGLHELPTGPVEQETGAEEDGAEHDEQPASLVGEAQIENGVRR